MKILCFEIEYVGFGPRWKKMVRDDLFFNAVKYLVINHNMPVKEARDMADNYRQSLKRGKK